ncbi:MAG: chitobiase/beta-hexosaminidase C-terminal domain-containing protein [Bacteroidales bacterium]|nr:chitobiase/beta-hexosaminidase C-terminal domain-containing protein [Bacteroidales bacterium]
MTKTYKLFLTAVVASVASISAMAQTNKYVKVTSAPTDWSGDYLIVYETGSVAFDGGLEELDVANNVIDVTISDGSIAATEATNAAKFTIAAVDGGYSVKAANGKYIGFTAKKNGLRASTTAIVNTISLDGSNAVLSTSATDGTKTLRFNSAVDQKRFRYFASGQQAIQLYKYTGTAIVTVAAPEISATATSFEESTTVTIKAEEGAAIYYTTDGTEPTAESTAYTAAFDVTETATVKAIAVKGGKTSSVASLALTKVDVTSMTFAEAYDWCIEQDYTKTTKYEGYVRITFDNAKVLYADETAIYVRQGEKAMQFYGFPFSEKAVIANDILNGTYAGQLQAYKGIPELSASTKITTAANVTVTNSEDAAAAISATVADVETRTYICDLVELTKVTITKDGDYFWLNSGDNDVEVKVTNSLIPTEYTNKLYNVTAVVSATYKNEGVLTLLSCEYVGEVPTEPGVVTAVEGVNANLLDANAPIYNLQGQRVDKNAKGILIQNGKKVLVK